MVKSKKRVAALRRAAEPRRPFRIRLKARRGRVQPAPLSAQEQGRRAIELSMLRAQKRERNIRRLVKSFNREIAGSKDALLALATDILDAFDMEAVPAFVDGRRSALAPPSTDTADAATANEAPSVNG
jgi:hypothetical protein